MIGQKQARIADFLKVVDNELSTTLHTMFVMSPFLGGRSGIQLIRIFPGRQRFCYRDERWLGPDRIGTSAGMWCRRQGFANWRYVNFEVPHEYNHLNTAD
jgi:hypothetical protein